MEYSEEFKYFENGNCCPSCNHEHRSLEIYNQLDDKLTHYKLYVTLPPGSYAQCSGCLKKFHVYEFETSNC